MDAVSTVLGALAAEFPAALLALIHIESQRECAVSAIVARRPAASADYAAIRRTDSCPRPSGPTLHRPTS
jgi:hypothetical protein